MTNALDQETLQHIYFVCLRPNMFVPAGSLLETIAYLQGFLDSRFSRTLVDGGDERTPQEQLGERLESNFLEWSRVLAEALSDHDNWSKALWSFFEEFARDIYELEHEPVPV